MQFGGDFVVISLGHISEGFDWARVCRQAKIPYAMLLHCNSDTWWFTDQEVDEAVASYTAARRVFCVSRQNLELLDIQLGTPLENGDIVWNPHNVAIDTDLEWPEDNPTLGLACIGRLNPEPKGQDLLMRIMSRPEWRERPVELNLYGAGPYEQSLRRICQLLELTNVHFRGHVNDVRTIWSRNHILVQSSRYEGVPMTVSEAMWCGRPAVVTNVGRCGELCVDGVTGFVAQEATVSSFGQALERAWERRSEWRNMGLAARTRADTFVPKNPVALFCDQLKACAAEEVLSASPELAIPAKPQKVLD
jgi:glycosyltransferase involved in cell wall biosynthesis